ncbi:MAG: ATP-binding protein, partial [Candidatus Atribacteria bacterium]|nr:ATP-binding protein [Candidatus Atribacteria bacterium]
MSKLGGPATIAGVDFEVWFVALKFVDAFFDENLKITPQAQFFKNPTTQKLEVTSIDDVYIHSGSKAEYYNIKSHAPNMRSWTVNSLYNQKVITQFKNQFIKSPDDFLYFVTKSPCPIFYEVLPRGASCTSREEVELSLSKTFLKEWNKIQSKLGFSDDDMISFAKQVKYKHIIDNEEMKKNIKYRLQGHVTSCSFVPDCLYQLAIEAGINSKTIKRDDVIEFLKKKNIHMKSHLTIKDLFGKLNKASANLYSINGNIENEHIEREEVNALVNWIRTPLKEESSVAVLTGKAGCGKTVIQRDLFLKIQRENIPVLGIKADLLMFNSIEALSNEIGLSGGIVAAMATLVEKYEKGVVIFDQIDALSFTLGKDRKSINTYFNLINQLSDIKGIRIILSCRSFDLKYDPILKSLEHKYTVDVKELSDQQVDKVLIKLGIERKKISNRLLDLLRTPLHLKIFHDIYYPDTDFNSINTLHNLYNELYNQKILNDINGDLQKDVFKALDIMIDKMDTSKVLTVPFSLLERNSQGINYLSSQSIVIRYNNKIQFFHSTFFDYCYARTFLLRHDSLIKIVLDQHQGLFIRPQVKQVLAYLRDSDFSAYLKELRGLLTNHKVRFHICLLVINQLAFLKDPRDEEWLIVKQLLEKDDNFKKHFINAIQSEKWLKYLISSGYLQILLQSGDEKIINLIIGKLRILINFYTNTIVNFLQQFPNIIKKDEHIVQVLIGLEHWEDEKAIRLFQDHLKVIKSGYSFNYSHFLLGILEYKPEVACKIFFDDTYEKINAVSSKDEFDKRRFFSHYDIEIIKKLLNWNSDVVLPKLLQLIHIMIDKTKWKSETVFFSDSAFYGYEQFEPDLYPHWQVLSLVLEKLKELAINDKSKFIKLVKGFEKSHSFTLLKIVLHGYNAKSDLYVEEGFNLLCRKGILENVTSIDEGGYKLRALLKNI